jgi:hypothetical protein
MSGKGGLPSSNLGKPTSKRHMSSLLTSFPQDSLFFSECQFPDTTYLTPTGIDSWERLFRGSNDLVASPTPQLVWEFPPSVGEFPHICDPLSKVSGTCMSTDDRMTEHSTLFASRTESAPVLSVQPRSLLCLSCCVFRRDPQVGAQIKAQLYDQ